MARIRSVKPEFWTSEQIAECSPNARLLFIGLWNFCDDYGVHPASCARLKMEIFPADAFSPSDIRLLIDALIDKKLVVEYIVESESFWFVTGWDKHQKPDTKTGKWPRPDGTIGGKIRRKVADNSPNEHRTVGDHSPTVLVLDPCSLIKDKNTIVDSKPSTPVCPHQEIIDLYHEILPMGTKVKIWNGTRATHLQGRWRESSKHQSLDFWKRLFEHCLDSQFLTSKIPPSNGHAQFVIALDWIVNPTNFAKIIEGRFHRESSAA